MGKSQRLLSLASATRSLCPATLPLASATVSLASATVSLASAIVSLASATLPLASATRSLFPATLSLASANVSLEIDGIDSGRRFQSRLLLQEHAATPAVANKLSELQSGAVAAMVASATLTSDEAAELATIAAGVPWANDADVSRVLAAFTVGPSLPPGKRRRSQQDYTMAHHFLTAGMWEAMLDPTTQSDVKLTALVRHLIQLGLRCPTEPTLKWVTSLWLVCCNDPVELGRMSIFDKTMMLKNTKVHFSNMRTRAPDPPSWVVVLPSKPVDMLRSYPLVFAAAFPGEASPAPPGVCAEAISNLDMTYSCRGGLQKQVQIGIAGPPTLFPASSSSSSSSSTPMDLQHMLMGFMQSMQANQQQMVQLMIHPPANMIQRPATSLAALENRSYRQQGSMLGFAPEVAPPRTSPLFEELQDSLESSPAKGAAPLADGAAAARETPPLADGAAADGCAAASVTTLVAIPHGSCAPTVAAGIHELFAMMQHRKDETKLKVQEAKAAKALEAKAVKAQEAAAAAPSVAPTPATAKGKGVPVQKEAVAAAGGLAIAPASPVAPKPAKAKGKGKPVKKEAVAAAGGLAIAPAPKPAKAKGKGKPVKKEAVVAEGDGAIAAAKAKGKCKIVKGASVSEAEEVAGDPNSKELSEVDKLRLETARLNAKNGKLRKLTASDGLGCAKCRWRFAGCTQCKGKTFTGFVWNPFMKK
jgi:hypothetical protein